MSLRTQILVMIAIPLAALVSIGGLKGVSDLERYRSAEATQHETHDALSLITVVHYLQVERGQSAAFLSSDGRTFGTELKATRGKVDDALSAAGHALDPVKAGFRELETMRKSVDALRTSAGPAAVYFTDVIDDVLTHVGVQLLTQNNAEIAQVGAGLVALIGAKESAGQQRAAGANGFGKGTFGPLAYSTFAETNAAETKLLKLAGLSIDTHFTDIHLQKVLQASRLPQVRKSVIEAGVGGELPDVTPEQWFKMASDWLSHLHEVEDQIAGYMDQLAAEEAQKARSGLVITAVCAGLAFLLSAAIGTRVILAFSRQFRALQSDLDKLARKEFDFEPAHLDANNEIGRLSRAMETTRAALKEAEQRLENIEQTRIADRGAVVGKLDQHLARLADRDLNCEITESFPEEYEALRASFNGTVTTLKSTMEEVVDAAGSIRSGAAEISGASDDLSRRTESQAATLEETAAALEQMTSSVRSAAEGARSVERTMEEARAEAENSGTVVNSAVEAMTEIEQSSSQIAQIIGVIDDIAFQTNLLALNAGVEAARAGEAGRGFAVVASEVRALAQRSAEAATEIKSLISESSIQVGRGVDLVGKAGEALTGIVDRVNNISQLISDIAEGAAEQSTGLGEINTGVVQLDQVTQQNAAMVEEATAAGHLLSKDAGRLSDLVAQFSLGAGRASAPTQAVFTAHGQAEETGFSEEAAMEMPAAHPVLAKASGDVWNDF
jgi:methyl-accepting chemotaxis protein